MVISQTTYINIEETEFDPVAVKVHNIKRKFEKVVRKELVISLHILLYF